jgi:3-oxoacyl-[acyl-carrier protein] reductase
MYTGKTVLITGTSRGIGYDLMDHFIDKGATVIGLHRGVSDADHPMYYQYPCDLSKPEEIINVFEIVKQHHPYVDILINNAAVLTSQYAMRMPTEKAADMVAVDLLAPFIVTKECLKLMKGEYGRIVNISSMAVALEPMGDSLYAACKAGLTTLSNIVAKECAFMNITSNTLAVSAIETDMLRQLNKDKVDKVVAGLPIPRYATMDDIINVVDFFCSPKSNYITAQTIYLGGVHK